MGFDFEGFQSPASLLLSVHFIVGFAGNFHHARAQVISQGGNAGIVIVGKLRGAQRRDVVQHQLVADQSVLELERKVYLITFGDQVWHVVEFEDCV